VILLTSAELDWEEFRDALLAELGGGRCRLAVGSPCHRPSDFARSHREAQLAATLQNNGAAPEVLTWESLGIYGILSNMDDLTGVERFVRSQIGALLDYDAQKNSNLVETLFHYLESGGNYAGASDALIVHRSTLKYRLQRIREIGQCDLSDPGTRFNLQLATRAWQVLKGLGRMA
jgi:DNA-binding PucR family transcriptional regulator